MTSEGLFATALGAPDLADTLSDEALVGSMLTVEAALCEALAETGVVGEAAARRASAHCASVELEPAALAAAASRTASPVEALVRQLRKGLDAEAAFVIHRGATSQDILDTALMLTMAKALPRIRGHVDVAAGLTAHLAQTHRTTPMVGRTLMQQAVPITFGLKCAGWLCGLSDASVALGSTVARLPLQFGGAAGTLSGLGDRGIETSSVLARLLGLCDPPTPWHTRRPAYPIAALAETAAACEKPALDIVLLAQTEVGEVVEAAPVGDGGSSTMPHKRNPAQAVLARAAAMRGRGLAAMLLAAGAHEHERAAGAWQAEWQSTWDLLGAVGGAAWHLRRSLELLVVDPGAMAENLALTDGALMAERASHVLADRLGRQEAHDLVAGAAADAAAGGSFAVCLAQRARLTAGDISPILDPQTYLGSAGDFVDRALTYHQDQLERT